MSIGNRVLGLGIIGGGRAAWEKRVVRGQWGQRGEAEQLGGGGDGGRQGAGDAEGAETGVAASGPAAAMMTMRPAGVSYANQIVGTASQRRSHFEVPCSPVIVNWQTGSSWEG